VAEVVVVGAGVGGLATAIRLASAGHRVTVFEAADDVGGKLGHYERESRAGTFRFDTGPSLLTLPQILGDLFESTGGDLTEHLDLIELDPIVRHRFTDGTVLDSCADQKEFTDRIAAVFGERSAREWRRLWKRAERVWDASWRHVLTAPARSTLGLSTLAWRAGDLRAIGPGQSLRGVTRRYLSDPRLRTLVERYATYTGADPRRAPAALLAIPYAEMNYGGWYLRGGLRTLAGAMLTHAEDLGVRVHVGTPVTEIDAGRRVRGVRLFDGTVVRADVVVANADALDVYRDLLPHRRRARRLRERSLGGFVMLLGVHGRTPRLAHHTVMFPTDYDAEFDDIFGRPRRGVLARVARDPTVFVTVADDPEVRPDGYESWFVLVNAPPHGDDASTVDWTAAGLRERYAERVLDVLETRGIEVRDRIVFQEIRTPVDLQIATGTPGGAIYGTPAHGLTGLRRPPNAGPVRGLYLVGGSVHPGGGLPMVLLSAKIVAGSVGPSL
jgi:phytoene desaturase